MPDLPLVGTDFAGYRLRSVLGRGGMSVVYQAENPRLGNVIALKVLDPALAGDEVFRTRFRAESQIAASLDHPNVIPIHDFGSSGGLLYIAMRYVSGTDLRQLIAEHGWLTPGAAVYLLGQAARALDAAHRRGLVHRDVKPGNLLVARSGSGDVIDPEHVYLADFGITKYVGRRSGLTVAGMMVGTVHYASPEQIQELAVLGTADQYSLGCVLYECLTGQAPFEKSSPEAILWAHVNERPVPPTLLRPELPPAIDEVIAQVLAKDPGERFTNCREFIAAARDAIATTSPRSPVPSVPVGFQPAPTSADEFPEPAAPTVREPRPGRARRVRGRRPELGSARSVVSLIAIGISVAFIAATGTAAGLRLTQTSNPGPAADQVGQSASPPPSELTSVLERTEGVTHMLPMSACAQSAPTLVQCTNPDQSIASVTFATYPSLAALYSKYQEIAGNLTGGHFAGATNVHACGPLAPEPTAESTWNHSNQYYTKYSVGQLASGNMPDDVAMGRVFCAQKPNGSTVILWTQDSGDLLGYATSGDDVPYQQVWQWFEAVHDNVSFPVQRTTPGGSVSASPLPSGTS